MHDTPVAVLLVDYAMPEMSGTELVRHAREITPDLAVVYVTGNADPLNAETTREDDAILRKPYMSAELLSAVAKADRLFQHGTSRHGTNPSPTAASSTGA
jgi:CheY-like chemotaxis protein